MIKLFALIAVLAAVGMLVAQPVFAGGAAGRGAFKGTSNYTCKSGKQVPNKTACKEFGGKQ